MRFGLILGDQLHHQLATLKAREPYPGRDPDGQKWLRKPLMSLIISRNIALDF